MRQFCLFVFLGILISFSSCRSDFSTVPSTGSLEFSKKKIYLDTVFSNIGSSTYGLKVYNRSNSDIKIPVIQLGKGVTSKYRLMVDGMTGQDADNNGIGEGKIFNNVELLAKDSLFIFIEITNNVSTPVPTEFTYDDQILFDIGSNQQKVDLTTLIWDANFIFPNRDSTTGEKELLNVNGFSPSEKGHTLTTPAELNWTNAKPYVIYENCVVKTGNTLTIAAGTRVYFHPNATLIIDKGATLKIEGHKNDYNPDGTILNRNEVSFEGDRLEPEFEDIPGQWGAVFILSDSNNKIDYLKLKNAVVGIYTVTADATDIAKLEINNSQIYDCSNFGILSKNSNITGKNLVINGGGEASFAGVLGGNYNFNHCTFNNDWSSSSQKAILVRDYFDSKNTRYVENTNINFSNCIIYGRNNIEILLEQKGSGTTFTKIFNHCLVKFDDSNASSLIKNDQIYDSFRNPFSISNIVNQNPKFKNTSKNQLNILTGSPADNLGQFDSLFDRDIDNVIRSNGNTDSGAYQVVP